VPRDRKRNAAHGAKGKKISRRHELNTQHKPHRTLLGMPADFAELGKATGGSSDGYRLKKREGNWVKASRQGTGERGNVRNCRALGSSGKNKRERCW